MIAFPYEDESIILKKFGLCEVSLRVGCVPCVGRRRQKREDLQSLTVRTSLSMSIFERENEHALLNSFDNVQNFSDHSLHTN